MKKLLNKMTISETGLVSLKVTWKAPMILSVSLKRSYVRLRPQLLNPSKKKVKKLLLSKTQSRIIKPKWEISNRILGRNRKLPKREERKFTDLNRSVTTLRIMLGSLNVISVILNLRTKSW